MPDESPANAKKVQYLDDEQNKAKDLCVQFFERGMKARKPQEMVWYRNIAFFLDHQYIVWDRLRGVYRTPLAPPWRVRHTENRLKPTTLHVVSKLTKNKAVYTVLPANSDDEALHTAKVGKVILGHVHQENKQDILNMRLWFMSYLYGISYKDKYWDKTKGKQMLVGVDDKGGLTFGNTGDISIEVLSAFQVVPELGARNEDQAQSIGKQTLQSLGYIRKSYPEFGEFVQAESTTSLASVENQISYLVNKSLGVQGQDNQQTPEKDKSEDTGFATIKELRIKPSKEHPKGRIIRVANGIYLGETELPYKFMYEQNSLGIVRYPFIEIPEAWYGDTPYNSLIPLQKRLNRNISAIQEIMNMMGKPKYFAHKDHKLSKNSINNEFEIIEFAGVPGLPPPFTAPASEAPMSLFRSETEDKNEAWDEISMLHKSSRGAKVPGIDSKVAMTFLEEQDQTVYQPILTYFENKEEIMGRDILMLAKEMYIEPRKLQILGKNKQVENFDFNGNEDISTSVRVVPGSSFPVSQAAKQQALFQGLESGMFGPIETIPMDLRVKILTSVDIVDVDSVFEELQVDIRESVKEHQNWMQGQVLPINVFDKHDVHLRQHDLFRKSDRYRRIQRTNPQLALMIDDHIGKHIEANPSYVQSTKDQQDLKEIKNIEKLKASGEILKNEAEYKGKEAERELALIEARKGNISKNQTVKE